MALADIVATLAPWTEELDVALDLSPNGLARHIGLECYLARGPSEEPRWTLLLDHLVGEGLCSPEKAQALLRWPGIDRQATSPVWPSSLEVADRFLGGLVVSYFFRRIHHVKVTFDSGRPREAKAYLIFGHQWLDHRTTPRLSARSDVAGGGSP